MAEGSDVGTLAFQPMVRLNPKTFQDWLHRMKTEIQMYGALSALKEPRPTTGEAAIEKWDQADGKARCLILRSLTELQMPYVRECNTAKEMIEILTETYARTGMKAQFSLINDLCKLRLERKEDCDQYCSKLTQIFNDLALTGMVLTEHQRLSYLVGCLSERVFGSFKTAVESKENKVYKDILKELRSECYPYRNEDVSVSETGSNYRAESKLSRKPICFKCKRTGHIARHCYANQPESDSHSSPGENNGQACKSNQRNRNGHFTGSKPKQKQKFNSCMKEEKLGSQVWIIDSGCSAHTCSNQDFFQELDESIGGKITVANGKESQILGKGKVILNCVADDQINEVTVHEVLYSPDISGNMLSVSALTKRGYAVNFINDGCTITRVSDQALMAQGFEKDGVYFLELHQEEEQNNYAKQACTNDCLDLWHRRLAHRSTDAILDMQHKNLAKGLKVKQCKNHADRCECCIKAKAVSPSFPKRTEQRTTKVLEIVHSDLIGPMPGPSIGRYKYVLTFIDDFSKYTVLYLLREKSEVHEMLERYIATVNTKFGRYPLALQTDNGGEYMSHLTKTLLESKGILHRVTVPYTPQQNSVAERKNRSLLDMTRSMLTDAKLPTNFWDLAIVTANYLQNRLITKGTPNNKTPFELWHGKAPNMEHLRVFGCKVYAYVPKERRSKLDARAEEGIFVGYAPGTKGYKIMNTKTGKITIRHGLYFAENERADKDKTFIDGLSQTDVELMYVPVYHDSIPRAPPPESETSAAAEEEMDQEGEVPELQAATEAGQVPAEPRRSSRENKGVPPPRFGLSYIARTSPQREPESWEEVEAMPADESSKWKRAAQEEIDALHKNKTWTLTQLPPGKKAISCKWVFKAKTGAEGEIERYKCRLVARGFSQKYGEDFDEVFAPVVKHTTIRLLLSIAASRKLHVKHLDVKTAFLHGEIKEELYMKQPPGFINSKKAHLVCKLRKGLYGLKQSSKIWNEKLHQLLTQQQFTQGAGDQCLYTKYKDGKWTYVLVYVDDLLCFYEREQDYKELVQHLNKEVEIKELGVASYYLGMQIDRQEDGSFLLSQKTKILDLIESLGLKDAHPKATPMETNFLKQSKESELLPDNTKYREAVGRLLYLSNTTRPDIATAVGILSRKTNSPTEWDWLGVKRVAKYLKGTIDFKLKLPASENPKLLVYTDADWGEDRTDRKSTSGHLAMYGNGPISWASRKQTTVALSSTESEYVATSEACKEIVWLCQLLNDLGVDEPKPIQLFEDNQSCIKLAKSESHSARTKHIDIRNHFVRDMIKKGLVRMDYCPTQEMLADILTKPLARDKFQSLREGMNLLDSSIQS